MTNPTNQEQIWPNLTRFGASLHQVWNHTLQTNFLELSIFDEAKFAQLSGHLTEQQLATNGYSDTANIVYIGSKYLDPLGYSRLDKENGDNITRFRSQDFHISLKHFTSLVPNITKEDFQMTPIWNKSPYEQSQLTAGIRVIDRANDEAGFNAVRDRHHASIANAFPGYEPGVFYSIPTDREHMQRLDQQVKQDPDHAVCDFAANVFLGNKSETRHWFYKEVADINPNNETVLFTSQLQKFDYPNIEWFKINPARAFVHAYPTKELAVIANNGSEVGVETENLPDSILIGMPASLDPKFTLLRNARFLPCAPRNFRNPSLTAEQYSAATNVGNYYTNSLVFKPSLIALYRSKDLLATIANRAKGTGELIAESDIGPTLIAELPYNNNVQKLSDSLLQKLVEHLDQNTLSIRDVAETIKSEMPEGMFFDQHEVVRFLAAADGRAAMIGAARITDETKSDQHFRIAITQVIGGMDSYNRLSPRHDCLLKEHGARALKQLEEKEAEKAQSEGISELLQTIAEHDPESMAKKRENAGEKIWGSRKDFASNHLRVHEIETMTPLQRVEVITKDNIWPRKDPLQMKEEGYDPFVAFVIKEIRASLPTTPASGGNNRTRREIAERQKEIDAGSSHGLELQRNFINTVTLFRESLENVKTQEELCYGLARIGRTANMRMSMHTGVPLGGNHYDNESYFQPWTYWMDYSGSSVETWQRHHCGMGAKCFREFPWVSVSDDAIQIIPGSQKSILRALSNEIAKKSTKETVEKLTQNAKSLSEQERIALLWLWAEPSLKKTNTQEKGIVIERPHLDQLERIGPNYRDGKDIDEVTFMKAFNFRGIEYGEWLSKSGAASERQQALNLAFDALCDCADALRVPPKTLSLNGKMAIALGSRGRGGKNAPSAHYEPSQNIMNLTRFSGAGKLAHEIGHALSRNIAEASESSPTKLMGDLLNQKLHNPLAGDMVELIHRLRAKVPTLEQKTKEAMECEIQQTGQAPVFVSLDKYIQSCLTKEITNGINRNTLDNPNRDDALRMVADHIETLTQPENYQDLDSPALNDELKMICDSLSVNLPDKFWKLYGEFSDRVIKFSNERHRWLKSQENRFEHASHYPNPEKHLWESNYRCKTDYHANSLHADTTRSKPYFSTAEEQWARAFETYIGDTLSKMGRKNDYLAHGSQNQGDYKIYPEGAEREQFNERMDAFFDEHRATLIRWFTPKVELEKTEEFSLS